MAVIYRSQLKEQAMVERKEFESMMKELPHIKSLDVDGNVNSTNSNQKD